MGRFPGRVRGYCYVNPGYSREALDELRRCVEDLSFAGVKLYNEYRAVKMDLLDAPQSTKDKIRRGNATRLLKLT